MHMFTGNAAVAIDEDTVEQRSEIRQAPADARAVLTFRGVDYDVPVLDISSRGTRVESDIAPRLGENVLVRFQDCSRVHGFVRWVRDGRLGINFGHEILLAN
jgi:hypothetical protein